MPLPSPSRQITFRSGQATAAPVASGIPRPIEPPMLLSQSWGGAPAVMRKKPRPVVTDSSATMAPSGRSAPSEAARGLHHLAVFLCADLLGQPRERGDRVLSDGGEPVDLAALRREHARLVRIGEEGHGRLRSHENEMAHVLEDGERLIDRIG